jgi:DNA polymerase/3'-5' exonuclease PolX
MNNIAKVFGIGKVKEQELKNIHKIKTVRNLKQHVKYHPHVLNTRQKLSLRYHDEIFKPIKREEAVPLANTLKKLSKNSMILGSYVRHKPMINDLDWLVMVPVADIIQILTKKNIILGVLSKGEHKASVIVKHPTKKISRKVDIFTCTKKNMPFMQLFLTGDAVQNIYMRQRAKKSDMKLNQYGLFHIKNLKPVNKNIKTEEDIFDTLKIKYKPPTKRNN